MRYFHVDFAFDVYFAFLLFEYDGVDQPRSGVDPDAGSVGERQRGLLAVGNDQLVERRSLLFGNGFFGIVDLDGGRIVADRRFFGFEQDGFLFGKHQLHLLLGKYGNFGLPDKGFDVRGGRRLQSVIAGDGQYDAGRRCDTDAQAAQLRPQQRPGFGRFGDPGHDVFEGLAGVEPGFRKAGVSPGFVSPEKGAAVRLGRSEPLLQFPAFRIGKGRTVELAGYQFFNGMFGCLHSIYITNEGPKTLPLPSGYFLQKKDYPAKKAAGPVGLPLFQICPDCRYCPGNGS